MAVHQQAILVVSVAALVCLGSLGIVGINAGISFGHVSPLIIQQAAAIANASSASECCILENALLNDTLACLGNGTCIPHNQTFDGVTSFALVVGSSVDVETCAQPMSTSCIPSAISITNLEANITGLGMLTSCVVPLPLECLNISGQTCPGGAVQQNCIPQTLTMGTVFADTVIVQNHTFTGQVGAVNNFTSLSPSVTIVNTTFLPSNVTCPGGAVINQECYTLGLSSVCSAPIPTTCYPSMLNFFSVTVQNTLAAPATVTCGGGPLSNGCMPPSALRRDGSGNVMVSGTLTAASVTGTATGITGPFAGDVTGTQGATSVSKIQGIPVSTAAPSNGDFLILSSGVWTPSAPGAVVLSLGGDASGTATSSKIVGLQGQAIASDGSQIPAVNQVLRFTSGAWRASTFVPIISPILYYMRARLTAPYSTVGTSSPWTALEGGTYMVANHYVAPVAGLYHVRAAGTVGRSSGTWKTAPGPAFYVNNLFVEYIHNFGQFMDPGTPQNFEGAMFAQLNIGDTVSIGNTVNSGMTSTTWSAWEVYRRSN
jgi:hypothetical protein